MPSPKDELIADLRGQVATLSHLLELALANQPPEASPGALRQRRYRDGLRNARVQRIDALIARDGSACRYCGTELNDNTVTIDHVIPLSKGGGDELDNLALACRECNAGKQDRTGITQALLSDRQRASHSDAPPRESDPPVSLQEDVTNVPPETEKVSNAHSGSASPKRNEVTPFDHDRAAADAAKHGLEGAAFEAELEHFEDYWASAGWRRKSGPVKDRNATWREWLRSPYRGKNGSGAEPGGYAGLREYIARRDSHSLGGAA